MLAATLVAAALRLFRLGHQSLWVDEIITWSTVTSREPMTVGRLLENVHGPFYSLLLHLWCRVAGESEWALRMPSVVLGTLLVPATAWLAARWLGRETAATAAWLTAGSPFLVWYAQEARNYSMLMLCVAVAGALFLGLGRRLAPLPLAAALATSIVGLLSNFSYAFAAPVHFAWWLGAPGGRGRRLLLALAALALVAIVVVPWTTTIRGNWDWRRLVPRRAPVAGETALRGSTTFHPGAIPFAYHSFAVGYTLGPPLRELRADSSLATVRRYLPEVAATALVFGALGVLGIGALRRRGRLGEALLWGVPGLVFVSYSAIQNFKTFHPRYLAVVVPMLIVIWAAAIVDLPRRARWVVVVLVAGLWMVSLERHYFDARWAKEDLRSAARVVTERGAAGERVIAVNTVEMLVYYYRGPLPVEHYWLGFVRDPVVMVDRFRRLKGAGPAWVLLARPEDLDPEGRFARWMDERYPDAERWRFAGVRLWRVGAEGSADGAP
ncbi:MAG: glycosyltransferase family 39 protein [Candidatus Eisenbacteria bacterium]